MKCAAVSTALAPKAPLAQAVSYRRPSRVEDEVWRRMFDRAIGLLHSAASFISLEAAHILHSGGNIVRDGVVFDKAGSVLVAVVVVASMFIMQRN